jgi:hypothetical protein
VSKLESRRRRQTRWRLFAGSAEKFDFAVFGSSVSIPIARELLWGRSRDYHSGCDLWDDVVLDAERCAAGDPALERSTRPGRSTVARLADLVSMPFAGIGRRWSILPFKR